MNIRSVCMTFATIVGFASPALATSLSIASSAIPTTTLNSYGDTINLASAYVPTNGSGTVYFQSGNFDIGNSHHGNQTTSFSFQDVVTFDGISKSLTFYGQDTIGTFFDTVSISAGSPVQFGSYLFDLRDASFTSFGGGNGRVVPITLSADLSVASDSPTPTPVPEPGSLILVGTSVLGALVGARRWRRDLLAESVLAQG